MGPLISADLHVAAGLDDEFRTHVIDLDTGADVQLERCEDVRALDQTGRLALIDGSILCEAELGQAVLPGPGVDSRVLDVRTGRTILDLGFQDMWSANFGPPAAGGLPDLVAVLNVDAVRIYRLPAGDLLGSYVSTVGFPLDAAFTADASRLAVTTETGTLAVIDLARLAADPADAVLWTAAAHTGSVATVVTSASGLIATTSMTGNVQGVVPGRSDDRRPPGPTRRRLRGSVRPRHRHPLLRGRRRGHPAIHSRHRSVDRTRPVVAHSGVHRRRVRPLLPRRRVPGLRRVSPVRRENLAELHSWGFKSPSEVIHML